jgi:hypothetical protein
MSRGRGVRGSAGTATANFTCRDPLPHRVEFACKGRLKLCAFALGHRICGSGAFPLELGAAGSAWLLEMDLATGDHGAVTGTATATLANAASESFAVTGKYNAKRNQSALKLESMDPLSKDKASFSNLIVDVDSVTSGKLKFVVAGEKGTETIVPLQ